MSKELNDKTKETAKVYEKTTDYFTNQTKGFVVDLKNGFFSLRKRGSDLKFKLYIRDFDTIHLEVIQINVNIGSNQSFNSSVAGVVVYQRNGKYENKHKISLSNSRQQLELQDIIKHVQRSLRPNAINFIMDD